jgi:hypothetical protein
MAILCTSGEFERDQIGVQRGGRPSCWRHRTTAWQGEVHHLAGVATNFLGQRYYSPVHAA